MGARLDRIDEGRGKALRRQDEWDTHYKKLDKRYRGQENTEIHDLVHAFNLTPGQLGQLLHQTAQSLPSPEAMNQIVKEDVTGED